MWDCLQILEYGTSRRESYAKVNVGITEVSCKEYYLSDDLVHFYIITSDKELWTVKILAAFNCTVTIYFWTMPSPVELVSHQINFRIIILYGHHLIIFKTFGSVKVNELLTELSMTFHELNWPLLH